MSRSGGLEWQRLLKNGIERATHEECKAGINTANPSDSVWEGYCYLHRRISIYMRELGRNNGLNVERSIKYFLFGVVSDSSSKKSVSPVI